MESSWHGRDEGHMSNNECAMSKNSRHYIHATIISFHVTSRVSECGLVKLCGDSKICHLWYFTTYTKDFLSKIPNILSLKLQREFQYEKYHFFMVLSYLNEMKWYFNVHETKNSLWDNKFMLFTFCNSILFLFKLIMR